MSDGGFDKFDEQLRKIQELLKKITTRRYVSGSLTEEGLYITTNDRSTN